MKYLVLSLAAIAASVLSSCAPEPYISVNQDSFEIGYEGGSVEVIVTSNYVWRTTSTSSDVVTVDPPYGSSGDTTTIYVLPNEDGIPKDLQIMFSCTSSKTYSKVNVNVHQGFAQPDIYAKADIKEIPYSMTNVSIILSSNFVWTSSYDRSRLTLTPSTGQAGNDTIIATFYENREDTILKNKIDFVCSSIALSDTSSIIINQGVAPAPSISVTPKEKSVGAYGSSISVSVKSIYPWTASASEELTLSSGGSTGDSDVTVTVPENLSNEDKKYFVEFISSRGETVVRDSLKISQAGR